MLMNGLGIGLVKNDAGLHTGEVTELGDREVKVSVMVRSGKHYKWPTSENYILYLCSHQLLSLHAEHESSQKSGDW